IPVTRPTSHADLLRLADEKPRLVAPVRQLHEFFEGAADFLKIRGGSTGIRGFAGWRFQPSTCVSYWKLASTLATRHTAGIQRWRPSSLAPAITSTSST